MEYDESLSINKNNQHSVVQSSYKENLHKYSHPMVKKIIFFILKIKKTSVFLLFLILALDFIFKDTTKDNTLHLEHSVGFSAIIAVITSSIIIFISIIINKYLRKNENYYDD